MSKTTIFDHPSRIVGESLWRKTPDCWQLWNVAIGAWIDTFMLPEPTDRIVRYADTWCEPAWPTATTVAMRAAQRGGPLPALTPEETCEFCGSRAEIVRSSTPICAACYYDAADVLPREIAALLPPEGPARP